MVVQYVITIHHLYKKLKLNGTQTFTYCCIHSVMKSYLYHLQFYLCSKRRSVFITAAPVRNDCMILFHVYMTSSIIYYYYWKQVMWYKHSEASSHVSSIQKIKVQLLIVSWRAQTENLLVSNITQCSCICL